MPLALCLFALLPWSVEVPLGATGAQLLLPAEPLIAVLAVATLLSWRREQFNLLKSQPVLALPLVLVGWQMVCASVSSAPLVSWKYVLVEGAHLWAFYLAALRWPQWWPRLLAVFGVSMLGVVVWTLGRHALLFHWRDDQALLAPMPFFNDHNVYAAVLGLLALGALALTPDRYRKWAVAYALLAAGATVLSTSRAALLALVVASWVGVVGVVWPRAWRRWGWVASVVLVALGGVFLGLKRATFFEKTNRDVSLQERFNRYDCAWQMGLERPWTGFGPGTFQEAYLPYQRPERMTRISVTTPLSHRNPDNYGRGGGAHSEYGQALAETGWPGLALWLALVLSALSRWPHSTDRERWLLLGLSTFFIHSILNQFFHDARVAALVWGMLALWLRKKPEKPADA